MKAIKIRSGGTAFILKKGEECPPDSICFMEDEWEWAQKLSQSYRFDPEQLQGFWATVLERKKTVPGYTVFMDFAPEAKPASPARFDQKVCAEIIQMLSKHKQNRIEE